MADKKGAARFVECRSFGPTLESASLPVIGGDQQRRDLRARVWRYALAGLTLFYAGLAVLLLSRLS